MAISAADIAPAFVSENFIQPFIASYVLHIIDGQSAEGLTRLKVKWTLASIQDHLCSIGFQPSVAAKLHPYCPCSPRPAGVPAILLDRIQAQPSTSQAASLQPPGAPSKQASRPTSGHTRAHSTASGTARASCLWRAGVPAILLGRILASLLCRHNLHLAAL